MTAQSVHRKSARRRRFIQTIHARAEVERSTNSAVEEKSNKLNSYNNLKYIYMKEVIKVVLLDELKSRLTAYEEPLKDLRDSL